MQFGSLIFRVPNTHGIGRPTSAVGTVKSSSAAAFGPFGFGSSTRMISVLATSRATYPNMPIIETRYL